MRPGQAGELIELEERLERSLHYQKLCEARILQLYPGHALPITQELLDEYESLPPPPPVEVNVSQVRHRRPAALIVHRAHTSIHAP